MPPPEDDLGLLSQGAAAMKSFADEQQWTIYGVALQIESGL